MRAARFWLTWLPAVGAVVGILAVSVTRPRRLVDLEYAFLPAARAVLHGHSPYAGAHAQLRQIGSAYIYPPPVAFLAIPFTALPKPAAAALFTAIMVAATVAGLWLLGVRDSRCYGLALVAHPVLAAELAGALSVLIMLITAAAWRWRDSAPAVGCLVALAIAAKLFCWPLAGWLVLTRRLRAAAVAAVVGVAMIAGSWAVIGFAGLHQYPRLLSWVTASEAADSYSLAALLQWAGVRLAIGELVGVLAALAVLTAAARSRNQVVFLGSVAATLLASPIVWAHYFTLLLIPCSLGWPRLAAPWFLLLGGWILIAHENVSGSLIALIGYQAIAAGLFLLCARRSSRVAPCAA